MGISQGQSGLTRSNTKIEAFVRFVREILYRRRFLVAIIAGMALLTVGAVAQEDRPEIVSGERKPAHKKDLGPRAIGVLQLGEKGRSSLVPIAILINGKFWDASVYKADPIPMSLDSGTVYEIERSGSSQGLFTVGSALHRNVANAPNPWIGTGSWVPNGTVVAKAHKAEITPVGLETKDKPPRLTRGSSAEGNNGSAPKSGAGTASSTPQNTSSNQTAGNQTASPPPPSKAPSSQTSGSPASNSPSSNSPQNGSKGSTGAGQTGSAGSTNAPAPTGNKPSDSNTTESKPAAAKPKEENVPASDSGASAENRPKLRRGRPTEPLPGDDDVEGYSKVGGPAASPSSSSGSSAKQDKDDLANVQLIPAISDAGGPQPHSYAFEWIHGEEEDRRKQMTAMAKDQLHAYLAAQAKATITLAPSPRAKHAPSKEVEPILENTKMIAYDLWMTNQPVIVFSAEAHVPPPSGNHADTPAELQYSILLVAYPDIYNNLHKLYAGVTDKYHLDVTPRLELVDAVDADGDGFGELLFRETSDAGPGWVIYRATADKLWKMFDNLSPE